LKTRGSRGVVGSTTVRTIFVRKHFVRRNPTPPGQSNNSGKNAVGLIQQFSRGLITRKKCLFQWFLFLSKSLLIARWLRSTLRILFKTSETFVTKKIVDWWSLRGELCMRLRSGLPDGMFFNQKSQLG
jgi:hypothetical protein